MVEQINLPPGEPPPPGTLIPIEIHAYLVFAPSEYGFEHEARFALCSLDSGLESYSDLMNHRSATPRYRTRTMGLPLPPVPGNYELRLDWRVEGTSAWRREAVSWPLTIEAQPSAVPTVTH